MRVSRYRSNTVARPKGRGLALIAVLLLLVMAASGGVAEEAADAVSRQQYQRAIQLLAAAGAKSADTALLLGRARYQMGDFGGAETAFEQAVAMAPESASARNWLGRAQGMRADQANAFSALGLARKARDSFEVAVKLDPRDLEAVGDLFSYYMSAPGFLGGGVEKARALAETIKSVSPADYAFFQAEIAEKDKDYKAAESHYLEARTRDPKHVGRWIDLAKFYTRRGMTAKAGEALAKAKEMAPGAARLLFDEANLLIQGGRNPAAARELLKRYRASALSDEDPPPFEVERLTQKLEKLEKK